MSENNSFLVFSGTSTRYLAEKICTSLGCPLGNLVMTSFLMASSPSPTRSRFADAMSSSFRAPSPTPTT